MRLYQVSVRDTLVLRDNRPMTTGAGRAWSMDIPWPSTVAGLARTRLGSDANGVFRKTSASELDALRAVAVAGPWLVEESTKRLFFPAPRDAVWFRDPMADGIVPRRLVPCPRERGVLYDDDGESALDLASFAEALPSRAKPATGPRFWSWDALARWNSGGAAPHPGGREVLLGLTEEERTHVALESDRAYKDGQLFTTVQRRFVVEDNAGWRSFAVGFGVEDPRVLAAGLAAFGGERRVATLSAYDGALPAFDPAPFAAAARLKVTLLTPAIFTEGAVPASLPAGDQGARVVAAIVPRPEVVSGWDFAKRKPKPTRRVVSAGSVFWLDTTGRDPIELARNLWLRPVSSEHQDRNDGYGLAVVSPG